MKTKQVVRWFARGGGIKKCGPFACQLDAVKAMMTTEGFPIDDCFVWPQVITEEVKHPVARRAVKVRREHGRI